jgi:ubiquinone/menaquinone biosynthesis C-methylase UbiE
VARIAGARVSPTGKVLGVDLNAGMLEIARSVPWNASASVEWRQANALDLPFDDGTFDLVLCQQGLQFFPDRRAALLQMCRVLKPGGRLALSVWRPILYSPGFDSLHNALTRHIGPGILGPFALSDAEELRSLVEAAAFRDISIRQATKVLEFPTTDEFVWRYVAATPLATIMVHTDDDTRAAIAGDVANDPSGFVSTSGLAFPIESHLLLSHA